VGFALTRALRQAIMMVPDKLWAPAMDAKAGWVPVVMARVRRRCPCGWAGRPQVCSWRPGSGDACDPLWSVPPVRPRHAGMLLTPPIPRSRPARSLCRVHCRAGSGGAPLAAGAVFARRRLCRTGMRLACRAESQHPARRARPDLWRQPDRGATKRVLSTSGFSAVETHRMDLRIP
jgi:hypothetical protein